MVDRINEILKYYHLTSSQFANEIGVQRSAMSHILSGRNKPSLDFVLKVLNRFSEISTEWLLFGRGNMIGKPEKNVQPDLFVNNYEKKGDDKEQLIVEDSDQIENNEINEEKKSSGLDKPEDNSIEKIVFFYKNGKFKEYNP